MTRKAGHGQLGWRELIPGMTVSAVGVSLVSFKYARWSYALFQLHPHETAGLYAATAAGLVIATWVGLATTALACAAMRYWRNVGLGGPILPEPLETMNQFWAELSQRSKGPDAAFPKRWSPLSIAVVTLHPVAGGACAVSISLLHVTLSAGYWLVVGGALASSAFLSLVAVAVYGAASLEIDEDEAQRLALGGSASERTGSVDGT